MKVITGYTLTVARGANQDEARVLSANFGSGATMKARAVELLLPNFRVPELIAA